MNIPKAITINEWERILAIPKIREAWKVGKTETVAAFAKRVLGVKFEKPNISIPVKAIYILTDGCPLGIRTTLYMDGSQLWSSK